MFRYSKPACMLISFLAACAAIFAQGSGGGGLGPPPSWVFSYEWSGTDVITTVQTVAGLKVSVTYPQAWTDHGGGAASNPPPSDGQAYQASVYSYGKCTVIATWTGSASTVPSRLFVRLQGRATSDASGSGVTGAADDGLRHPEILSPDDSPVYRASLSSGPREVCIDNPGAVVRIPVTMSASAYSLDTQNSATTALTMTATDGTKAAIVWSNLDPTYRREVTTDSQTGWTTGICRLNARDATGTIYGDTEVGLAWTNWNLSPQPLWGFSYAVTYSRGLAGPWNTVFNDWYVANPDLHLSDGAASEIEWVTAQEWATGSAATFYINGTKTQTVRYIATDDGDGFKADNWYVMTLHGPAKKEEKYKGDYRGPLNAPASDVSAQYHGLRVGEPIVNTTDQAIQATFTVTNSASYTYGWQLNGSASATIEKICDVEFGARYERSTQAVETVGNTYQVSVPAHSKYTRWRIPFGTVGYWNQSRWASNGYQNDVRIPVTSDDHFELVSRIIGEEDYDSEPYA